MMFQEQKLLFAYLQQVSVSWLQQIICNLNSPWLLNIPTSTIVGSEREECHCRWLTSEHEADFRNNATMQHASQISGREQ